MMADTDDFKAGLLRMFGAVTRKARTLFDARTRDFDLTEARARLLLHLARSGPLHDFETVDTLFIYTAHWTSNRAHSGFRFASRGCPCGAVLRGTFPRRRPVLSRYTCVQRASGGRSAVA